MHELLPDWIQDTQITTTNDRKAIPLRANAIDDLIANLNPIKVSDLVALAFGTPSKQVQSARTFREIFRRHDVTFRISHEFALQVLSGAALLTFLEGEANDASPDELRALAATATLSTSYAYTLTTYQPKQLLQTCVDYLNHKAQRRRNLTEVVFQEPVKNVKVMQRKLQKSLNPSNAVTAEQLRDVNTLLKPFIDLLPSIPAILHNQDVLQEDSELTWWILGGYSGERNLPFSKLGDNELPGVLAYELAQRTRVLPSGVAAQHLISHVTEQLGRIDSLISLRQFVESAEPAWLEKLTKSLCPSPSPPTTPILHALYRFQEQGERGLSLMEQETQINVNTELTTNTFGYAMYQECLVRRLQGTA